MVFAALFLSLSRVPWLLLCKAPFLFARPTAHRVYQPGRRCQPDMAPGLYGFYFRCCQDRRCCDRSMVRVSESSRCCSPSHLRTFRARGSRSIRGRLALRVLSPSRETRPWVAVHSVARSKAIRTRPWSAMSLLWV